MTRRNGKSVGFAVSSWWAGGSSRLRFRKNICRRSGTWPARSRGCSSPTFCSRTGGRRMTTESGGCRVNRRAKVQVRSCRRRSSGHGSRGPLHRRRHLRLRSIAVVVVARIGTGSARARVLWTMGGRCPPARHLWTFGAGEGVNRCRSRASPRGVEGGRTSATNRPGGRFTDSSWPREDACRRVRSVSCAPGRVLCSLGAHRH